MYEELSKRRGSAGRGGRGSWCVYVGRCDFFMVLMDHIRYNIVCHIGRSCQEIVWRAISTQNDDEDGSVLGREKGGLRTVQKGRISLPNLVLLIHQTLTEHLIVFYFLTGHPYTYFFYHNRPLLLRYTFAREDRE